MSFPMAQNEASEPGKGQGERKAETWQWEHHKALLLPGVKELEFVPLGERGDLKRWS